MTTGSAGSGCRTVAISDKGPNRRSRIGWGPQAPRVHLDFRSVRTFHLRDSTCFDRALTLYSWDWANINPDFDPIAYGRAALASGDTVKPCRRCFPECFRAEPPAVQS